MASPAAVACIVCCSPVVLYTNITHIAQRALLLICIYLGFDFRAVSALYFPQNLLIAVIAITTRQTLSKTANFASPAGLAIP
jgi:hypothetical protein